MLLRIVLANGQRMTIETKATETVGDVKALIEHRGGPNTEHFDLVYNGATLDEKSRLKDAGVAKESLLTVQMRNGQGRGNTENTSLLDHTEDRQGRCRCSPCCSGCNIL